MDNTIADRLKEARNKAGMHQEDAARSMEMSRPTLSAIESGKRVVSAEEIESFLHYMMCPVIGCSMVIILRKKPE